MASGPNLKLIRSLSDLHEPFKDHRQNGRPTLVTGRLTCRILSWDAGVRGVLRAMLLLVTLYSDSRVLEAELVMPDSSAV